MDVPANGEVYSLVTTFATASIPASGRHSRHSCTLGLARRQRRWNKVPGRASFHRPGRMPLEPKPDARTVERFRTLLLPHLDAAYGYARWLTRNPTDAQDVAQEALLKALRYFHSFRGEMARPWLLRIVRNTWID